MLTHYDLPDLVAALALAARTLVIAPTNSLHTPLSSRRAAAEFALAQRASERSYFELHASAGGYTAQKVTDLLLQWLEEVFRSISL